MLLLACDNGNVQMVRYLLGLEEVDVSACTADGKTGLHLAAIHDYPELAQELIQHHVPLTAQDAKVKGVRTLEMWECISHDIASSACHRHCDSHDSVIVISSLPSLLCRVTLPCT